MINLQAALNQAAICHPPPHVHDHLLLSVRMYTSGGWLPVGLSCNHAMPRWASAHQAVRWECHPLPSHTGKIC